MGMRTGLPAARRAGRFLALGAAVWTIGTARSSGAEDRVYLGVGASVETAPESRVSPGAVLGVDLLPFDAMSLSLRADQTLSTGSEGPLVFTFGLRFFSPRAPTRFYMDLMAGSSFSNSADYDGLAGTTGAGLILPLLGVDHFFIEARVLGTTSFDYSSYHYQFRAGAGLGSRAPRAGSLFTPPPPFRSAPAPPPALPSGASWSRSLP